MNSLRKVLAFLLAAVFCMGCLSASAEGNLIRYEGDGFATPEETVQYYMEGFRDLDFGRILGAFAWETQAERMSIQQYLERLKSYSPATMPRMPAYNDFMTAANIGALQSSQISLIYRSIESYILGEDAPDGMTIVLKEPEDVAAFLQKFENGRLENLAGMENIRFLSPDDVTNQMFSTEKNQENFKKQTAYYNADEVVNVVGVADVGDETFFCCPTVARYGDRWYLVSVSSMTSSILGLDMVHQAFACGKDIIPSGF